MRHGLLGAVLLVWVLVSAASAGRDLAIEAIASPDTVASGWSFPVRLHVANRGSARLDSIPLRDVIRDSSGAIVHENSWTFLYSMLPGDTHTFYVDYWGTFDSVHAYFTIAGIARLPGDENRQNDTAARRFWYSTEYIRDTLDSEERYAQIDGEIEPGEYYYGNDISDFPGRAGVPRPRVSCLGYSCWSGGVCFAVDVRCLNDRRDGDRVVLLVDEDMDGVWESDSSEGAYTVRVNGTTDTMEYLAMPDSVPLPCDGWLAASRATSGHLQMEFSIPNGGRKSDITIPWQGGAAGAALSFWRGDSCYGWWPSTLELARWAAPADFGTIWWVWLGIEEQQASTPPRRRMAATLTRSLPAGVVAFDAMGRRVVSFKAGVYFVRTASGKLSAVGCRKVVIPR